MRGVGTFPVSIALVGMRDLRDYLIKSKDGVDVNPGSPFNVKEDSASLSNFTREDVRTLIGQHEEETGQIFEEAAKELVWELARGQPWLTNALCKKCVWTICPQEEGRPVKAEHLLEAKEMLITERAVHLDSLLERLRDPRIRKIVEIIMTGESDPELLKGNDFRFALSPALWEPGASGTRRYEKPSQFPWENGSPPRQGLKRKWPPASGGAEQAGIEAGPAIRRACPKSLFRQPHCSGRARPLQRKARSRRRRSLRREPPNFFYFSVSPPRVR
ncbi:MAG: hypothetical protein AVO35_13365 [Candidatus Aegiribacteria sp. MLS_C]|nr:MAG: hypothetical protein AVO35_13365 [Candidatus Aegiribacteria sp. MLS_C]